MSGKKFWWCWMIPLALIELYRAYFSNFGFAVIENNIRTLKSIFNPPKWKIEKDYIRYYPSINSQDWINIFGCFAVEAEKGYNDGWKNG